MNERKYEIMEAHLKGELSVIDLIDRIVELEKTLKTPLNEIKDAYTVKEYIFRSREEAQDILRQLEDWADRYGNTTVAVYYDMLCVTPIEPTFVDNNYGWTLDTLRRKASIVPYRNKYSDRYNTRTNGRYVIKFPPVEVIQ